MAAVRDLAPNSSSQRWRPSTLRNTDFALLTGSKIIPLA